MEIMMSATAAKSASKILVNAPKSVSTEGKARVVLHKSMQAYGKRVSADRESALAFLKRIGAPVKTKAA